MGKKRFILFILSVFAVCLSALYFTSEANAAIENVTAGGIVEGTAETLAMGAAGSIYVEGGNITEFNLSQKRQTDWWQGVWGSVDLNVTLEDASGDVFYNWGLTAATGEIYFYNESNTDWTGMILATSAKVADWQENSAWGNSASIDNFTSTYTQSNNHPAFNAGTLTLAAGDTAAVNFESSHNCTVLNSSNDYPVFAALITQDLTAYNGETADFECLLPVKASEGIVQYYAYAELT
ncbi:hypothetical protein COV93_03205 [Candidatus Woesearchaeota archaeon CG11_big_fil_rev_8_21_14_0_20_43_8]|nr:MAG: hypothetical protein COV93_03205 [Candidatus Woesearchaeota archaeon CG11_big_fil_rev_8_21_14_0_20_43_8]